MTASPELSELIKRWMAALASRKRLAPFIGRCVTVLGVLPLHSDLEDYMLGVRADGEVVIIYYDRPDEYQNERDHVRRNMALVIGSKSYPELRELLPARPPDASVCTVCEGTGVHPVAAVNPMFAGLICPCGGVGWLPKGYTVEPPR